MWEIKTHWRTRCGVRETLMFVPFSECFPSVSQGTTLILIYFLIIWGRAYYTLGSKKHKSYTYTFKIQLGIYNQLSLLIIFYPAAFTRNQVICETRSFCHLCGKANMSFYRSVWWQSKSLKLILVKYWGYTDFRSSSLRKCHSICAGLNRKIPIGSCAQMVGQAMPSVTIFFPWLRIRTWNPQLLLQHGICLHTAIFPAMMIMD